MLFGFWGFFLVFFLNRLTLDGSENDRKPANFLLALFISWLDFQVVSEWVCG